MLFRSIEYYLPLFFDETATLFDYLPANTSLILHHDVAAAMRDGLLAFSTAAGLVVMRQMLDAELASIVGVKHAKLDGRVGNWHGTTTGQVVLGARKISVARKTAT